MPFFSDFFVRLPCQWVCLGPRSSPSWSGLWVSAHIQHSRLDTHSVLTSYARGQRLAVDSMTSERAPAFYCAWFYSLDHLRHITPLGVCESIKMGLMSRSKNQFTPQLLHPCLSIQYPKWWVVVEENAHLLVYSPASAVSQGSIVSAIGSGINAIISAIAGVIETIVGAIVTVRICHLRKEL